MGFLRWLSRPYYSALDGDELPDRFKNSHVWKSLLPWLLGALLISASFAVGRLSVANATAEAQSQKAIKTEETFRGLSRKSCADFAVLLPTQPGCSSRRFRPLTKRTSLVEVVHHEFIYNRTFGENSLAAAKAWEDLFPQQGGYFRHPVIAPRRATFSVFHYLHCLVRSHHAPHTRDDPDVFFIRMGFVKAIGRYTA